MNKLQERQAINALKKLGINVKPSSEEAQLYWLLSRLLETTPKGLLRERSDEVLIHALSTAQALLSGKNKILFTPQDALGHLLFFEAQKARYLPLIHKRKTRWEKLLVMCRP